MSPIEPHHFKLTREQLHEKVWSTSSAILCEHFGISTAFLIKLCEKHFIPKPTMEHWWNLRRGVATRPVPVPKIDNPSLEVVEFDRQKFTVAIPATIENLHPLASETLKICREIEPDENGMLIPKGDCLDFKVSPHQLERAIRIYSAVLETFEMMGNHTKASRVKDEQFTRIIVNDEPVRINLHEHLDDIMPKTDKERNVAFSLGKFKTIPSGRLGFWIISARYGKSLRGQWRDTDSTKIEIVIGNIVGGVLAAARQLKAQRLKGEEHERRQDEVDHVKRQATDRLNNRLRKEHDLIERVADRKKSREVHLYLDELEASWIDENGIGEYGSEFAAWLIWAREYANTLNPIPAVVSGELPLYDAERDPSPSQNGSMQYRTKAEHRRGIY